MPPRASLRPLSSLDLILQLPADPPEAEAEPEDNEEDAEEEDEDVVPVLGLHHTLVQGQGLLHRVGLQQNTAV